MFGCVFITAAKDAAEIHPLLSVTANVYDVPLDRPEKLAVVPVELIVWPPGAAVTVQVPVAGSPLNATVPVEIRQVGCVIAPKIGEVGVYKLIAALLDKTEVHPAEFVTENV